MKPNQSMIDMWTRAADAYHEAMPGSPAEDYLRKRGLSEGIQQFKLGYVDVVAPGHEERFRGTLSIPYFTPSGVVAYKFRRLASDDLPKYDSPSGQRQHSSTFPLCTRALVGCWWWRENSTLWQPPSLASLLSLVLA